MFKSQKTGKILTYTLTYAVLIFFAFIMLFPFFYMLFTSLKLPKDTFRYPPRLLPRDPITLEVAGYDEPLPLYHVTYNGELREFVLVEDTIRVATFADPNSPAATYERQLTEVKPTGGYTEQQTVMFNNKEEKLFDVEVDGQTIPMVKLSQTAVGRFANPDNPAEEVLQNVRLSQPVEVLSAHPENYTNVMKLQGLDRSLTNTALVTILVVLGQLTTSILGGYAFARLNFPGRDQIFLLYLGTIMIPFVVLIIPLYQIMVMLGWVDKIASLVVPWVFTAYGTFMTRQFFLAIPKEIEEAAHIDGASRLQILWRIFIPASTPVLATQATISFLYAWNSFVWPLIVINTGNYDNHVLTLSLNILRGRASDSPNLILAGAAIAVLPPLIVFILAQRYYIESVASSGVKG